MPQSSLPGDERSSNGAHPCFRIPIKHRWLQFRHWFTRRLSVDVRRLATFYEAVLGVSPTDEHSDDIRLLNEREEVLIHSVPARIAGTIEIRIPPEPSEGSALKPVFDVISLESALADVKSNGGVVTRRTFSIDGLTRHDVLDPDGNVIQLRCRDS